ncbi:MAG: putative methyltransferase [Oscillospiraceae bacterium]|nr:putative methyltransferase [Oscillospiraceae bacterium]
MDFKKNEIYEVDIIDISSDGSGIVKLDGYTVFVPSAAVGDHLQIRLVKVLKNYGFGKIEQIISPSNDRIKQDCPVFEQCGGCSLRHISYESELLIKQKIVQDAFERIGDVHIKHEPILPSERINFYRNKAQYPFGTDPDGKVIAGFFAKRSHRVIESENCFLQPEIFGEILKSVLKFANDYHIPAYNEVTGKGILRNLYIRQAQKTEEIMVCIVSTQKDIANIDVLVGLLRERFPKIVSIYININNQNTNVILGEKYYKLFGKDNITDVMCGIEVELSPPSFYQVNKNQAERLYGIAKEFADFSGDEVLLDFFCGVGTIGLSMASEVKKLIGVEIIPQAVENATKNAKKNCIENAEFFCADAKDAARKLLDSHIDPDIVLVDPPRKGCDDNLIESIAKMAPQKIIMVSCNPATAARDANALEQKGYQVKRVRAVDMFPRTMHVETVVLLAKQ